MSLYVKVAIQFRDVPALCAALLDLKSEWAEHVKWSEETRPLFGYHGDERPEIANLIIPRSVVGSASNDIGFVRGEDGQITAIISQYDQNRYGLDWIVKLKEQYSFRLLERDQRSRGRTVRMERNPQTGRNRLIIEGVR